MKVLQSLIIVLIAISTVVSDNANYKKIIYEHCGSIYQQILAVSDTVCSIICSRDPVCVGFGFDSLENEATSLNFFLINEIFPFNQTDETCIAPVNAAGRHIFYMSSSNTLYVKKTYVSQYKDTSVPQTGTDNTESNSFTGSVGTWPFNSNHSTMSASFPSITNSSSSSTLWMDSISSATTTSGITSTSLSTTASMDNSTFIHTTMTTKTSTLNLDTRTPSATAEISTFTTAILTTTTENFTLVPSTSTLPTTKPSSSTASTTTMHAVATNASSSITSTTTSTTTAKPTTTVKTCLPSKPFNPSNYGTFYATNPASGAIQCSNGSVITGIGVSSSNIMVSGICTQLGTLNTTTLNPYTSIIKNTCASMSGLGIATYVTYQTTYYHHNNCINTFNNGWVISSCFADILPGISYTAAPTPVPSGTLSVTPASWELCPTGNSSGLWAVNSVYFYNSSKITCRKVYIL